MNPEPDSPATPAKPEAESEDELKSMPMDELERKLESSPDGLTRAEAAKRLERFGPNEITEKKTSEILKFLSYFWGPIPWMIEVAVILSGVVRHWPDFFIILVLLLANAVVGFWEEREAGNAIAALKAKLAVKARVRRDGAWINPEARELVPGDAIRLRLGDIVPAEPADRARGQGKQERGAAARFRHRNAQYRSRPAVCPRHRPGTGAGVRHRRDRQTTRGRRVAPRST